MQTAKANGDLMDRARAWLRAEHPGESADVTEWRLNTMLDKDSAAAKAPAGVAKADRDFASLLKERKDLPDIVRELYGEYRDPWINYTKSVAKMANLIAHKQFMATVKQAGLQTGFLSAADAPNPHHFRQIDPATTPRLAELAGLYTDPATAKSLQDLFSAETHSQLYRYAVKLSALAKMNATIFNSKVHVRNALGNLQFAFANGDFFQSPAVWAKSARLTIDHLLNRGDDGARQYVRRLAELRLADSTIEVNELRAMSADMIDMDAAPRDGAWAKLKGSAGDVVAGASRLYQSQDTFWKILAFENKKTQYARAYPDKDYAAIEKLAAADVRAHYPSYDKLPKLVRTVSQFPLAAPFISFPSESVRTLKNSLATIQREIASDNPAIREMGMSRAVGLVSSFALVPAIAAISKAIVGVSAQEEEDLRKFQAPWAANAQFLYLGKDGEGNYDSLDLSFLDARSIISKPLLGMLRSGGWEDRFDRAVAELTAPLGEDLFFGRALSVLRNKTADGRPVYIEQADDAEKLRQLGWFMGQPMIPGTIQQLDRIRKGAQGEVRKGGKPYDAQLEAAALLGLRVSSADTKQSSGFRSMDLAIAMSRAEQGIAQVASSRGTITPGQLARAYTMYNQQRAKLVQDWHEMAMSAIRLGVPQAEVYRSVLTTAGERDALMIISGRNQAYRPSEQLLRTVTSRPDGQSRALQLVQLHRETTEQIAAELAMGR
jgi:hypothetical protein